MDYSRVFRLIAISSVMVVALGISLLTASWWPLVLLATIGWIVVELRAATNKIDSLLDSKDIGSISGKTKR